MLLLRLALRETKNYNSGLKILTALKNLLPYPQLILNIFAICLHILGVQILTHTRYVEPGI